jgi:hypothetical protein
MARRYANCASSNRSGDERFASDRERSTEPNYVWAGAAIAIVLWSPWILWQADHGWPQIDVSSSIAAGQSTSSQPWWAIVPFQFLLVSPLLAPVWIAGLMGLLRDPASGCWSAASRDAHGLGNGIRCAISADCQVLGHRASQAACPARPARPLDRRRARGSPVSDGGHLLRPVPEAQAELVARRLALLAQPLRVRIVDRFGSGGSRGQRDDPLTAARSQPGECLSAPWCPASRRCRSPASDRKKGLLRVGGSIATRNLRAVGGSTRGADRRGRHAVGRR